MSLTIVNADLSQAELRVMALESNDEWMISALQPGQGDFFTNHMMPICFPSKLAQYGTMEQYKEINPVLFKEDRTKVKAVQYGLAFGRQARAIADELKMPVREAQRIISNYLDTAYDFQAWREGIMLAAVNPAHRYLLTNKFGRKFQSEVITQRNYNKVQREALSFIPQSTASDICLATAIRIQPILAEAGAHIFNIVHDAIMVEVDEDHAETVGEYVSSELTKTGAMVYGNRVPFLADWSSGKSWADLD